MREIKFRAWDRIRNKWIDEMLRENQFLLWNFDNRQLTVMEDDEPNFIYHFNSITIIQFTGLKDKNGKEIYEGDVVKYLGYEGKICFENGRYFINYIKSSLYHTELSILELSNNCYDKPKEIEVIGNIYENPELLE